MTQHDAQPHLAEMAKPDPLHVAFLAALLAVGVASSVPVFAGQDRDMPDPLRTPGKLNPVVTEETMNQTICVSGWSAMVRPPSAYTSRLKRRQLNAHYQGGKHPADYEEDHLVPLELGGAPKDPANLWPEPWDSAHVKDRLEGRLHNLVCSGQVPLAEAQHAIASDWRAAFERYIGQFDD